MRVAVAGLPGAWSTERMAESLRAALRELGEARKLLDPALSR